MDYIFFDFNGTIIDDLDLCLDLLNKMLIKKSHKPISKERYLDIFTFPVKKYYIKAGFDLPKDNFEELADFFIEHYTKENINCKIFEDIIPSLEILKKQGKHLFILSASEKSLLMNQLKFYNLDTYFDDIIGKDNIYAEGKDKLGKEYILKHNFIKEKCLFIGDTLHDFETASLMGIKCYLISRGHQSEKVLKKAHCPIFKNLKEIIEGGNI